MSAHSRFFFFSLADAGKTELYDLLGTMSPPYHFVVVVNAQYQIGQKIQDSPRELILKLSGIDGRLAGPLLTAFDSDLGGFVLWMDLWESLYPFYFLPIIMSVIFIVRDR